jgi:hypothetical protein
MEAEQEELRPSPATESQRVAKAAPVATATDLSAEIAAAIEREPGDRVRVTWISGRNYRCNWWAPGNATQYDNPTMPGLLITTHRVRKSRFLSVTKIGGSLLIK